MKVNVRVPGTEVGSAKALPPGGVRPALGSGVRGLEWGAGPSASRSSPGSSRENTGCPFDCWAI